jgi:hypothetical protein
MQLKQHERGIHVVCATPRGDSSPYHRPRQYAEGAGVSGTGPERLAIVNAADLAPPENDMNAASMAATPAVAQDRSSERAYHAD